MAKTVFMEAPAQSILRENTEDYAPANHFEADSFLSESLGVLYNMTEMVFLKVYGDPLGGVLMATFFKAGLFASEKGIAELDNYKPLEGCNPEDIAYEKSKEGSEGVISLREEGGGREIRVRIFKPFSKVLESYFEAKDDSLEAMIMLLAAGKEEVAITFPPIIFAMGVAFAKLHPDKVVRIRFHTPYVL